MAYESLTPRSFTDKELKESLKYYTDCVKQGFQPLICDYMKHFRCLHARAEMLRSSAAWAYEIKQKEKAQMEAKRKKAC